MPVRVGYPGYNGTLAETVRHPRYSTGVGLLLAGLQQHRSRELARMNVSPVQHALERMKSWFTGNF
jgi:cell division protein FtsA